MSLPKTEVRLDKKINPLVKIKNNLRKSANIEADEKLKILERLPERICLIRQPEIRESHIEKWRHDDSKDDLKTPEPGIVLEGPGWIEKEYEHDENEEARHNKGLDIQVLCVQEGENGNRPHYTKYCRQLKQMLFR